MRIAVVGVGLIGGSVGLAAKEKIADARVRGYDLSEGALAAARERGAIDEECESIEQAAEGAAACFVCAPVGSLGHVARKALEADGECVVTDVGSTKEGVLESLVGARLDDETLARFVGGHPLAGAEAAGVEHARADLFEGAIWYLTPTARSGGMHYDRLQRAVADIGARPQALLADDFADYLKKVEQAASLAGKEFARV